MKTGKEKLISKYLSGNASVEDEKELFNWLKEDPANEEFFEQAKSIWTLSSGLKKESEDISKKAWEDFKALAANEPEKVRNRSYFSPLQIAAGIALIVSLILLINYFIPAADLSNEERVENPVLNKEKEQHLAMITIHTQDSVKVFYLPDSSRVHLNKNSSFTYPEKFTGSERSTSLSGEAFFEVIHNGAPFAITCKETKTTVLGTSFNIKGYNEDEKLTVSVVTGTVQLSNKENEKITLTANEKGTFDNEHSSLTKTNYTEKSFWWKKHVLRTKIRKIIKKIKQKIN